MRKNFFSGLAILLPLLLTLLIVIFIIKILTQPFTGLVEWILNSYKITELGDGTLKNPQILRLISTLLSLLFFVAVVLVIGLLGKLFFFRYLLKTTDKVFYKIPLVNKIYQACKDVVKNIFFSEKSSFTEVVLVPYPFSDILALGLITRSAKIDKGDGLKDLISVFIPATPNPTMGFLLLFEKEQVIFTDIKVSHAIKVIVSCGAKFDEFQTKKVDYEESSHDDPEG